jgi:hypothetical protein
MEREVVILQNLEDVTIIKKSKAIMDEILLSFPGCTPVQIRKIGNHFYGWDIITPNAYFSFWSEHSRVSVSWHIKPKWDKYRTHMWKYIEIDFQSFFDKHKFGDII